MTRLFHLTLLRIALHWAAVSALSIAVFWSASCAVNHEARLTARQVARIAERALSHYDNTSGSSKYVMVDSPSFGAAEHMWYVQYDLERGKGLHSRLTVRVDDFTGHPEIWVP